jgi:REP element-mobilizing transposase RayT
MRLPHLAPFACNPLVFLTTCAKGRRPLFANEASFSALYETWNRSADTDGWCVGRFVVMPDHVHLFARPATDAKPLAAWTKSWKSISARRIAAVHAVNPPVWQPDYFDHFVRSADSYSEKWEYVRHNPVRAGLVTEAEHWPWHGVIHDLSF